MTLTPEGRVGVGTTSPTAPLDVVGKPGWSQVLIRAAGSSPLGSHLVLANTDTGGRSWDFGNRSRVA
jgi:hypothetical protein